MPVDDYDKILFLTVETLFITLTLWNCFRNGEGKGEEEAGERAISCVKPHHHALLYCSCNSQV